MTKEYIKNKKDALQYKDEVSLCYDNPILFDLKWTGEHFKDLYLISTKKKEFDGKKGLVSALKYDWEITKLITSLANKEGVYQ